MATTKVKKRNPQDATLRNIRALKARVAKLEKRVGKLERSFVTFPMVTVR